MGYVEIEGKGELVGRGTGRIHVVRLAEVVAGMRRTSKKRKLALFPLISFIFLMLGMICPSGQVMYLLSV